MAKKWAEAPSEGRCVNELRTSGRQNGAQVSEEMVDELHTTCARQ